RKPRLTIRFPVPCSDDEELATVILVLYCHCKKAEKLTFGLIFDNNRKIAVFKGRVPSSHKIPTLEYGGPWTSVVEDRKSTRLNSSHVKISYAVFCLKKKNKKE